MSRLRLTVNESKTRIREVPQETFDFAGYTFGPCWSYRRRRMQLGTRPSKQRIQRICRAISQQTAEKWKFRDEAEEVGLLNQMMAGWAGYFCLGSVSRAYRAIDMHARKRLRQWLSGKHKRQSSGMGGVHRLVPARHAGPDPAQRLDQELCVGEGVKTLLREPDAGNPPVRFDEREVETESRAWLVRHRQTKGPDNG